MEQCPFCDINTFSAGQYSSQLMKAKLLFLSSQQPATGPYREPDKSISILPSLVLKINLNTILSTP
jgi:hypothetical protein